MKENAQRENCNGVRNIVWSSTVPCVGHYRWICRLLSIEFEEEWIAKN
jgi:hypothetical protein